MVLTRKKDRFITFMFFIILIPFFSIAGIKNSMSEMIYQGWQIAATALLILMMLMVSTHIKLNWAVGLFAVYQVTIFGSTFVHQGFSPGIFVITAAMIMIFMLLQSHYYYELMDAICILVTLVAVVNFITIIMKVGDTSISYFIGGKNSLSIFLIPGTFVLLMNSMQSERKVSKKTVYTVGLCLFSVLLGSSGTGLVVAALTIVLMLTVHKFKPNKPLYLIVILIFYVVFIFLAEEFVVTRYWLLFTDLLEKDSTMTSRTAIWDAAKSLINDNWLFGFGRGTRLSYVNTIGRNRTSYEAHNFILEILLEGGVAALALYATLFTNAVKHLNMNIVKNRVVFIALCVLLINGLTESTVNNCFVTIIMGIACRYAVENQGGVTRNGKQIQKT